MKRKRASVLLIAVVLSMVIPAYGSVPGDGKFEFDMAIWIPRMRELQKWTLPWVLDQLEEKGPGPIIIVTPHIITDIDEYERSELPGWEMDVYVDGGRINIDRHGVGGRAFEAEATTLAAGLSARKDRFRMGGEVHFEDIEGEGANNGLGSDSAGFVFMPGYRVWTQEENGVNVDVDGIFDFSEIRYSGNFATAAPDSWFFTPGIRAAVNRMTEVGLFQATYVYTSRRNIDGDRDPATGKTSYNSNSGALDYVVPITEQIYGNIGISHIALDGMPNGMDDKFTDINIRLGSLSTGRFNVNGGFFTAIDGRDTYGFNLHGIIGWK